MDPREIDRLIEEALTAWRPRDPAGRVLAHPAWSDLDETSRGRLFDETLQARALERAIDSQGLSTTARAVLARIRRA